MGKNVDDNGYWLIKHNPVTKEGVFPYLGKSIDSSLEPEQIYMVYRPYESISSEETLESFNCVPLIENHEMLGEGFTPYDNRKADGVLFNTMSENGVMYGDIKIFSENLKKCIEHGKKELSIGYTCDYVKEKGDFNGENYDYKQLNIIGNHIALVEKGRAGRDVRVYDKAITYDYLDIEEFNKKEDSCESSVTEKENNTMDEDKKEVCPTCGKDPCECKKEEPKAEDTAKEVKEEVVEKKEEETATDACVPKEEEAKAEEPKAEDSCEPIEEKKEEAKDESAFDACAFEKCVKDLKECGDVTEETASKLLKFIGSKEEEKENKEDVNVQGNKEEDASPVKQAEDSCNELRQMVKEAVEEAFASMKKEQKEVHFSLDEDETSTKADADWLADYLK